MEEGAIQGSISNSRGDESSAPAPKSRRGEGWKKELRDKIHERQARRKARV